MTRWSLSAKFAILNAYTGLPFLKAYRSFFTTTVWVKVKSRLSWSIFYNSPPTPFSSMMPLVSLRPTGNVKAIIS